MVAESTRSVETRARKRKRELDAQVGVAIPGLSFDVTVSLVEKHLPDPADLAVLRAVSHGMRDAVDATGRKMEEFKEDDAVERGYLSTLKCLRRRGRLSDERLLCAAAARNGDLEELKAMRAENLPWNEYTCAYAAKGGHLEVLKWARENGCPWHAVTIVEAAKHDHAEICVWAIQNGCPVDFPAVVAIGALASRRPDKSETLRKFMDSSRLTVEMDSSAARRIQESG